MQTAPVRNTALMITEKLPAVDISKAAPVHGNRKKIAEVMKRASSGDDITIGFIGGSITQGCLASDPKKCYAYKVFEWFSESFPAAEFTYINAGIGATDSQFACARADRDLLVHGPDMVFVEFSVNDESTEHFHETYEGLVRKILKSEKVPAVMLIHNVRYDDGGNAETMHTKVAEYYDIPSVSMKDAIWPGIESGQIENRLITPDDLHPNDLGHSLVASVIISVLEEIRTDSEVRSRMDMPEPETPDSYEDSVMYNALDTEEIVSSMKGFETDREHKTGMTDLFKDGWYGSAPGSSMEFKVTGSCISLLYRRTANRYSPSAEVLLDGRPAEGCVLKGEFDETWGDKMETADVLEHGECREHTVTVRIPDDEINKRPETETVPLYICGMIVSGREKR